MSYERNVSATARENDIRLDRWLSARFTYRSRNAWRGLIEQGKILVNDRPCRPSKVLRAGDVVRFVTDDFPEPAVDRTYRIVWETPFWLAVDKSGDLPCHPAGPYFRETLWSLLREARGEEVFTVHRLDRETSGLVVFGKSTEAAAKLSSLFAAGTVHKEYRVCVHGDFPEFLEARGRLVDENPGPIRKQRTFIPGEGAGEFAETRFERIAGNGRLSVVRALPATGRLHQIRATALGLGYPVVGDKIYGLDPLFYQRFIDGALTDADREALILPRQALHAERLRFVCPFSGETVVLTAPVPADMASLVPA